MGKGRKVSREQGLGPGEAEAERHNGAARRNGQRQNGAARRNGQQQDGGSDGVTSSPLTLGQLVTLSGVPASTVHHYRRLGLLPAPQPARSGRFAYGEDHVRALVIIRELREERGMPLGQIKVVLPGLLEGTEPLPPGLEEAAEEPQQRLIEAAIRLFSEPKGYASVTVSEIAAAAGIAKGSVYRHFPSKEALFTAVVENLCQDTADRFAQAVAELGGPDGLASDPAKTAIVFGRLITRAMPILLELGARAARGDVPSQLLAARVLRTLAEAAGRPLSDNPVPAGLEVIETAFHTVLQWAVGPDWASRDTPG
jgi:AcrR family transcriptional regulator